jgi:hypothetical protein
LFNVTEFEFLNNSSAIMHCRVRVNEMFAI